MAEEIKHQNELPTVKLSLGLEGSASSAATVQLEIDRGADVLGQLTLSFEDLGVHPEFDPASFRYEEPPFRFSEHVRGDIERMVGSALKNGPLLWLQLNPPVGHLASMPWETMLEPVVGQVPIVRIPNFLLNSPLTVDVVDMVICLSEPKAKDPFAGAEFLRKLVPALLGLSRTELRLHIFTDAKTHSRLQTDPSLGAFDKRVLLHDPAYLKEEGQEEKRSAADATRSVRNPWLRWIVDEMREATADVAHFVTHGYLQKGQSALALAASPLENKDPLWAHFIGPGELAAFLDQLGAWSVGFTSPPFNFSSLGLRQFFDDVARLRAGPVLHHEASGDGATDELASAYADLFLGQAPAFRRTVSMYAHPGLFVESESPVSMSSSVADTLVTKWLDEPATVSAEDSVWTTSTQRYLEQTVARMFPVEVKPESHIQKAAADGVAQALKFVNEVLSKHAEVDT